MLLTFDHYHYFCGFSIVPGQTSAVDIWRSTFSELWRFSKPTGLRTKLPGVIALQGTPTPSVEVIVSLSVYHWSSEHVLEIHLLLLRFLLFWPIPDQQVNLLPKGISNTSNPTIFHYKHVYLAGTHTLQVIGLSLTCQIAKDQANSEFRAP